MTRTAESSGILTTADAAARRRHRSKQERRGIVEESLQPGASVAVVARSHGVNANQVFQWRKLYRKGLLGPEAASAQLLPVRVAEVVNEERERVRSYSGSIRIELGQARVRIEGSVDPETLRAILEHLRR